MIARHPIIRPCAPDDADAIDAILRALWQHDPAMLAIYRMHRIWEGDLIRHTLVAEVAGAVVGAGTLFESTIHPHMLFLTINVAPDWQRQGVGTALYDALHALGDTRPWQVKMTRRDAAGMAFLIKLGYHPLITQINGVIDPARDDARAWLALLPHNLPGYRVVPVADAAQMDAVARVLAEVYRQYHAWNPPAPFTLARARALFTGPAVIPGTTLGVYEGARIIGAANLFIDAEYGTPADEAYLSQIGIVGTDRPDAEALTALLIRREVEIAAGLGMRVRFEADDTYTPHHVILSRAPTLALDRDFVIMGNVS